MQRARTKPDTGHVTSSPAHPAQNPLQHAGNTCALRVSAPIYVAREAHPVPELVDPWVDPWLPNKEKGLLT